MIDDFFIYLMTPMSHVFMVVCLQSVNQNLGKLNIILVKFQLHFGLDVAACYKFYFLFEQPKKEETISQGGVPIEKDETQEGGAACSSPPSQDSFNPHHMGPRAISMDHNLMQRYIKNLSLV